MLIDIDPASQLCLGVTLKPDGLLGNNRIWITLEEAKEGVALLQACITRVEEKRAKDSGSSE